jgi:hypothetical protein
MSTSGRAYPSRSMACWDIVYVQNNNNNWILIWMTIESKNISVRLSVIIISDVYHHVIGDYVHSAHTKGLSSQILCLITC